MTQQELIGQQTLLRIFIGESDRHEQKLLYLSILEQAREMGLAGCSTFRGAMGFGSEGTIHSDFPPDYAENLPIIIELIDTENHISQFLQKIEPLLKDTLVTEEKLHVHYYRRR